VSTETQELVARLRELLDRATPPPWRWAGYIAPDHFEIPEIRTTHSGQIRVLAFPAHRTIRTVYANTWDPVDVPVDQKVEETLYSRIAVPEHITINERGEEEENGEFLAYVEHEHVMAFQHPQGGSVEPVGADTVPPRWDCFRGRTTTEAGKEPYRYDISGIDHPDADLLIEAVNALPALLDALEAK